GIFSQRQGFARKAEEWIRAGLEAAAPLGASHPELRARLLYERAGLLVERGKNLTPEQAAEFHALIAEARALFEQVGDADGQARAENLLGLAAMAENDLPAAREHFARALAIFEQAGDEVSQAIIHHNFAYVEQRDEEQGDPESAIRHSQEALRLRRAHG